VEKSYCELIEGLELLDIYLGSVQFKRYSFPDADKYPAVKASFSGGKTTYKMCGEELCVDQEVSFILEEVSEDEKKTRKIFSLKGVFTLIYFTKTEINEEVFSLFKKRNVPVNLHPYARELIQNMMVRAGLPSFTLPALKIKR
jgi:preprotein translocase subunit SecB